MAIERDGFAMLLPVANTVEEARAHVARVLAGDLPGFVLRAETGDPEVARGLVIGSLPEGTTVDENRASNSTFRAITLQLSGARRTEFGGLDLAHVVEGVLTRHFITPGPEAKKVIEQGTGELPHSVNRSYASGSPVDEAWLTGPEYVAVARPGDVIVSASVGMAALTQAAEPGVFHFRSISVRPE